MNQGVSNHVNIRCWTNGHLKTKFAFHGQSYGLCGGVKLLWQQLDRLDSEIGSDYLGEEVRLC